MRRGFSLLEMMLVLALLVIVAGLAMLPMRAAMEGQKLRKAGDQMRTEWAKARNLAMKSGRLHMFRYKVGAGDYEVRAWFAESDMLESNTLSTDMAFGNAQPGAAAPGAMTTSSETGTQQSAFLKTKKLPDGITFALGIADADTRATQVEEEVAAQGAGDWSVPILFYPDGSSSNARLSLANNREQYISLELRGLTGLAQMTDLQTHAEVSQ